MTRDPSSSSRDASGVACAVCGRRAFSTARLTFADEEMLKDLCRLHLSELIAGTRPLRRLIRRRSGR